MRKTNILSVLLLVAFPLTAFGMGRITIDDTIAGLRTGIRVDGVAAGTYDLVVARDGGSSMEQIIIPIAADASGTAETALRPEETEVAGTYRAYLEHNGAALSAETRFTVLPDTIDASASSIEARGSTIDVRVADRFGNPLAGRSVTLFSARPGDVIEPITDETDTFGIQTFSFAGPAGSVALRAADIFSGKTIDGTVTMGGALAMGNDDFAYNGDGRTFYYAAQVAGGGNIPPPVSGFRITGPKIVQQGVAVPKIVVTAMAGNRTSENYLGTVVFSSTDPQAILANFGRYAFTDPDLGNKEFPLGFTFKTPGEQTLRVEDANDPTIFGELTVTVGGRPDGGAGGGISITSHKNNQAINTIAPTIAGRGPSFSTIVIQGGIADVETSTNDIGDFSAEVPLNPEQRDFTIRARTDNGRFDSGPMLLKLDMDKPEIGAFSFSPETPAKGVRTLFVVETEPGATAVLDFADGSGIDDVDLKENATSAPGVYQGFFTPTEAGVLQPTVTVTDAAGNAESVKVMLTVGIDGLAVVQNVKAEAGAGSAKITWDPVDNAQRYVIYIGPDKDNLASSLDTQQPVTGASVMGLVPGKTYAVAVAAAASDEDGNVIESEKLSAVVMVTIPGLVLTATPGDSSVLLKWEGLSDLESRISSYVLRYGPAADQLVEQRMLNKVQQFQARDLMNGIHYYFRLVPITTDGILLEEFAVTADATPNGGLSFHAAPSDPIPDHIGTGVPQPGMHGGAPIKQPLITSGLSTYAWMTMLGLAAAAVLFYVRRRKQLNDMAALLAQTRYPS